jgi:protein phosphatase
MVSGDEADQGATHAAFGLLHRELALRLAEGKLTVVDATSVQPKSRRALLARAAAAGVPATAIVLDLPAEIVLARNAARRPRVVDEEVVRHHLARLRASLDGPAPPLLGEGFAQVVVLRDPA